MSLLDIPAGASLHHARRRLHDRGLHVPLLLSDGASAASSSRAAVSFTGGAAHTMGSWTEIVASLSADVGFVKITPTAATSSSTVNTSALFNLGVGAGGAESIVLDALGVGWWGGSQAPPHPGWLFPIFIPRGSRVAGQVQGAEASKSFSARFEFFSPINGLIPSRTIKSIGAVTASSRGAVVTASGSANTESAWAEITAATTEPYTALGISVQGGDDTTQSTANLLVDVAAGAAGSEVPLVSDLLFTAAATEQINPNSPLVFPCETPAGVRLAARFQAQFTGGTIDVILHGVRRPA